MWRRADYEALFDGAPPGALTGESTTLHLRDPRAHERIAATTRPPLDIRGRFGTAHTDIDRPVDRSG